MPSVTVMGVGMVDLLPSKAAEKVALAGDGDRQWQIWWGRRWQQRPRNRKCQMRLLTWDAVCFGGAWRDHEEYRD